MRSSHLPTPIDRRLRLLALSLLGLLLLSCTGLAKRIGARRITGEFVETFDLDAAQEQATRAAVDRLIAAAPSVLRGHVDEFVEATDQALAAGFTEENLLGLERRLDRFGDDVAARVIDEAAPVLVTLDDRQINHALLEIKKRFNKDRDKLDKPPNERLEDRQAEFVEAVEDWTGDLSATQVQALRHYAAFYPDYAAARIDASERRVERMAQVLRARPTTQRVREALRSEWQRRGEWGPDVDGSPKRRATYRAALIYIDGLFTPVQRQNARAHLRKLHARLNRFLGSRES